MTTICTAVLVLTLSVSAYSDTGPTASGAWTTHGTAACGPTFPFGTRFLLAGRTYTCTDRGGLVTDQHLDLWMPNESDAWAWGRATLPVHVAACHDAPAPPSHHRTDRLQ